MSEQITLDDALAEIDEIQNSAPEPAEGEEVQAESVGEPEAQVAEPEPEPEAVPEVGDDKPVPEDLPEPDTADEKNSEESEELPESEEDEEKSESEVPEGYVKIDDLDDVKTTIKINGEDQEVNIKDLKDGYQLKQRSHQEINRFKDLAKSLETTAQRLQSKEDVGQLLADIHGEEFLVNESAKILEQAYGVEGLLTILAQSVEQLKQNNPQEYNRRVQARQQNSNYRKQQTELRKQQEQLKLQQDEIYQSDVKRYQEQYNTEIPSKFEKAGLVYNDAAKQDVINVCNWQYKQYGQFDVDQAIGYVKQKYDSVIGEYQKQTPAREGNKVATKTNAGKLAQQKPKARPKTPTKRSGKGNKTYTINDWKKEFDKTWG